MINNFEDLETWKECRKLRILVSKTTKSFPPEDQENIQFCRQARGSLTETLDHFICAFDEQYIILEELNNFRVQYDQCLKLLNGYIAYLKKMKQNEIQKPITS